MAKLIRFSLIAGTAACLCLGPSPALASKKPFHIVIDPGHGGADQGAIFDDGKLRVAEKDATLLIARQVFSELRRRGYEVTLTRSRDEDITLPNRTALANKLGADVFLSIHMNSTQDAVASAPTRIQAGLKNRNAQGIETYFLNNTSDASSKRLAHLENKILGGSVDRVPQSQRGEADPAEKLDVALILKDLRLDGNMAESKRLACSVQSELLSAAGSSSLKPRSLRKPPPGGGRYRNRGVKQALFHVLLGADMPSALVEAGFLNSPHDRELILSPSGRHTIGMAIAKAVDQYQHQRGTPQALQALRTCQVH